MSSDVHVIWTLYGNTKDILLEVFIPKAKLLDFLASLHTSVNSFAMNLLNVTIREVRRDTDSLLPYAKQDVFALVLLFSQAETPAGEQAMQAFATTLYADVVKLDGTFYLPYRRHYDRTLLFASYPNIKTWIARKREFDPEGAFSSQFFDHLVGLAGE